MDSSVGWDADPDVPRWAGFPRLEGVIEAAVCVVGLGGSGLAALEELRRLGVSDVVGVDAGRVAAGAAGRNGGLLSCGGALQAAGSPLPGEVVREMYAATSAELEHLAERLGPDVVRRTGLVTLEGLPGPDRSEEEAAQRERDREHLRVERDVLRAHGIAVEDYEGPLGRGIRMPQNGVMNPVRRAFGLASEEGRHARLFEHSPVTAIRPGEVVTERGAVRARHTVVCVDGRLDRLLPQVAPLVRTVRLQMAATAPVERIFEGGLGAREDYDYAQQDRAGRILAGGGRDRFLAESETTEAVPTRGVQAWIDHVIERIAGRAVPARHRWAASAGFTRDGLPICLEADEGVVACGGYSGLGNLVGPVAGRAAVRLALEGAEPPAYFHRSLTERTAS